MKKFLVLLMAAVMVISMVTYRVETTLAEENNTSIEEITSNETIKDDMLAEALSVVHYN